MRPEKLAACELCRLSGGQVIWSDAAWRVVRVDDSMFPAFYRVIAHPHVAEFTDLAPHERGRCMELVARVEQVLREQLRPAKVNLASLGNVVPHLHWHVVARFDWDSHYPQPVWGAAQRPPSEVALRELAAMLPAVDAAVGAALAQVGSLAQD